jgi:ribonuclease inhibitor
LRRTIVVDCDGVLSEAEFWSRYEAAAGPREPGFGRNLDAFWDAAEGDGPGSAGEVDLRIVNCSAVAGLGDGQFLEALRRIASETRRIRVTLEP